MMLLVKKGRTSLALHEQPEIPFCAAKWSLGVISMAELFSFPARRFLARLAGSGLLALLAGCATRPDSAALQSASRSLAPSPVPQTPKIEIPKIAPPLAPPREARKSAHVPPNPPPPEIPAPILVGLNENQITALLGAPAARTGDGPGRHLYYRLPQCTLNLSLYPNVDTHVFRLLSYEVTGNDGHNYGKQICDSELAAWLHARQRARDEIAAGR